MLSLIYSIIIGLLTLLQSYEQIQSYEGDLWGHWIQSIGEQKWANDANLAKWINDSELAQQIEDNRARVNANHTHNNTTGSGYCSHEFLAQFGFNDLDKAVRVCQCESSGNADAKNGQYDGIYQLSDHHTSQAGGNDPSTQAQYVANYTNRNGWGEWECQ